MRIWPAVVVAAALLLSGCTVVSAPEPGFTDADLDEMTQRAIDLRWYWTGLPDELRPPDPERRVVSVDEWANTLASCMNEAGFDQYQEMGGGLMVDDGAISAAESDSVTVSFFVCESSVAIEGSPEFVYNQPQIDYLYDYFQQTLVPCLALHGVSLVEAPTKQEFDAGLGWWNPYYSFSDKSQQILTDDDTLFTECPSVPPGMGDDELAAAYGH